MPTYAGSGTEPLGSNPSPKTGSITSPDRSAGKTAGGTENLRAYQATLAATKLTKSPTGGANRHPAGVKSFNDGSV